MHFINGVHKKRYLYLINKDNTMDWDVERLAMFYIFAGMDKFFDNIENLYDFNTRKIRFYSDGDKGENTVKINPSLSSSERKMNALAFHLFNHVHDEEVNPFDSFQFDQQLKQLALYALCIRFNIGVTVKPINQPSSYEIIERLGFKKTCYNQ